MRIWNDYIEKENKHMQIYDKYVLHPSSIRTFTDKPNVPTIIPEKDVDLDFQAKAKKTFEDYHNPPKAKQKFPQTSNQEFGWDLFQQPPEAFRNFKRDSCKETAFATNFSYMKGHSLYSNKNKL